MTGEKINHHGVCTQLLHLQMDQHVPNAHKYKITHSHNSRRQDSIIAKQACCRYIVLNHFKILESCCMEDINFKSTISKQFLSCFIQNFLNLKRLKSNFLDSIHLIRNNSNE